MTSRSGAAEPPKKRLASVYDAVAGRISGDGFIHRHRRPASRGVDSHTPIPADEILFQPANAPVRYEEADIYLAPLRCLKGDDLPSSDLLKAIHRFASLSYLHRYNTIDQGSRCWKSMDGTALLVIGILVEELAKERIGPKGDLGLLSLDRSEALDFVSSFSAMQPSTNETYEETHTFFTADRAH